MQICDFLVRRRIRGDYLGLKYHEWLMIQKMQTEDNSF